MYIFAASFVPKSIMSATSRPLFFNPLLWLRRFRHRRGYGVHSPFAFGFITGVVYERTPYYAYAELVALHPWWMRLPGFRPIARCRLLFRLANFAEARTVSLVGSLALEREYVCAAVPSAAVIDGVADFVLVAAERIADAVALAAAMSARGMLVVEGIHQSDFTRAIWKKVEADPNTGVTFDLYDYGIAFFDHSLTKQHYVVNF